MTSIIRFQELVVEALANDEVMVPQLGRFSGTRFFQGLRHALSAFNALAYRNLDPRSAQPSDRRHTVNPADGNLRRNAFEVHPISYRLKLTAWMAWMTEKPLERWPRLYRLSYIPAQLPRHWCHPWEAVDEDGRTTLGARINPDRLTTHTKVGPEFFETFFTAADGIGLQDRQIGDLLGGISLRTVQKWRMHPIMLIRPDCSRKMAQLVRIWTGLTRFSGHPERASEWLRTPNHFKSFQGRAPVEALLCDEETDGREFLDTFFGAHRT